MKIIGVLALLILGCQVPETDEVATFVVTTTSQEGCRQIEPQVVDLNESLPSIPDAGPIEGTVTWEDGVAHGFFVIPDDNDACIYEIVITRENP